MKEEVQGTAAAKVCVSELGSWAQLLCSCPCSDVCGTMANFPGTPAHVQPGSFLCLEMFYVPEAGQPPRSWDKARPGPSCALHLHHGFLLHWLSLTNTNHLHILSLIKEVTSSCSRVSMSSSAHPVSFSWSSHWREQGSSLLLLPLPFCPEPLNTVGTQPHTLGWFPP